MGRSMSPTESVLKVLVLYLKRPQRNSAQLHALRGALRIQRLEGSRPHGGLCILNGAGRLRRLEEVMVRGMIHSVECGTELRDVAQRCRAAAGTTGGRGVSAS